jgi:hypothetical protein
MAGRQIKEMSLKDSKDPLERLYGDVILGCFPNYEVFWLKFIGNPREVGPYKYSFPLGFDEGEKKEILDAYEMIQMWHYSLFCHFAGAHFNLEELENSLQITDVDQRFFRHWEYFEVGYIHLGSVFYYLFCLWSKVMKLRRYPGKYHAIDRYLKEIKKDSNLVKRFLEVNTIVKNRRDQAIHYGRTFTYPYEGRYYIPLNAERDMKWSEASKTTRWLDSIVALREDLCKTEKLLNDLHEILRAEYQVFINDKRITIDGDQA